MIQKGAELPHYRRVYFREKDKKVKNAKTANHHSCRQQCKSAAFFAYDKTAQLQMIDRFPDHLSGSHILRLEAELKREALKKQVGKQADNYHYLKAGAEKAKTVIEWYLKRLFHRAKGTHLRYQDAVRLVRKNVTKHKTQERLLYLLRKVSDSQSLDAALRKTREHFGLSAGQCSRLLTKLDELGIHPVTLPNQSPCEVLPPLIDILREKEQ